MGPSLIKTQRATNGIAVLHKSTSLFPSFFCLVVLCSRLAFCSSAWERQSFYKNLSVIELYAKDDGSTNDAVRSGDGFTAHL